MPTPQIISSNLQLISPQIPSGLDVLSIDSSVLPFVFSADVRITRLEVSIGSPVTTYTLVSGANQFSGTVPIAPDYVQSVSFTGRNYNPSMVWVASTLFQLGDRVWDSYGNVYEALTAGTTSTSQPAFSPTVDVQDGGVLWHYVGQMLVTPVYSLNVLSTISNGALTIGPPSGISSYNSQNVCRIEWVQPTYPGVLGVRVMVSTDASGVTVPYTQFGDLVSPNSISRTQNVVLGTNVAVSNPDATTSVTTTTDTLQLVTFCSVDIPQTSINTSPFYAMLSVVVQDPVTNIVYESQQAGPITCGFVDLKKVSPSDFLALQRKEDIASRLISSITKLYPDLDLSPRSEIRDLMIDPIAIEISNMSVREWFSRVSASVSALSQVDDADGDGFSDVFAQSSVKQQIARAYGLNSSDTQTLIDQQFDVLGEAVGLPRNGATASLVTVTFYTYVKPTSTVIISSGTQLSTIPDSETPSLTFTTTATVTLDAASADNFYDPVNGWWGLNAPAQCTSTGSMTNVGSGSIRSAGSSLLPSNWNVTNLVGADFGLDTEINSKYAARITSRYIKGIDSGTRNGYLTTALATPGIIGAHVVAAGDTEMLRDWDSVRKKHVYGCVDIYVRGANYSQQTDLVAFQYQNSGNLKATWPTRNSSSARFNITRTSSEPTYPFFIPLQLVVSRPGSVDTYLGVDRAYFDGDTIVLNDNDPVYQYVGDNISKVRIPIFGQNGNPMNNAPFLQMLRSVNATFSAVVRYQSPLSDTPAAQPVVSVTSITGPQTGVVSPSITTLVHSSNFLTYGGSNMAGDRAEVPSSSLVSPPPTVTVTCNPQVTVAPIDSYMSLSSSGDVLSVRSIDMSTLYTLGVDYTITQLTGYKQYGLQLIPGTKITPTQSLLVSYNKYALTENLTLQTETVTITSTGTTLSNSGFVNNVWLPLSHGNTTLIMDGWNGVYINADGSTSTTPGTATIGLDVNNSTGLVGANVPYDSRYIKVVWNGSVMKENTDFTLSVDPVSGTAAITRMLQGRIPDDTSTVTVSYFTNEAFSISTQYPAFVSTLVNIIDQTKHAAADVLVKSMIASPVDITMTVTLEPNATPETMDANIRTVIGRVLDNATGGGGLYQSELIRQVKAIPGVQKVQIPLNRCAKSDGSYNVGVVIPTQTSWTTLSLDPAFAGYNGNNMYISSQTVLPDNTIPSGGYPESVVGLMNNGDSYNRALTIQQFLQGDPTQPMFYIIGQGDEVSPGVMLDYSYSRKILLRELDTKLTPTQKSYLVTYQVFNEGGANDIDVSSTEYLTAGTITLDYVS